MSKFIRAGDRVRVRSAKEILPTLDSQGSLDGLPFMPEMLEFCGQEFTVYRRADKVCDTVNDGARLRRMRHTVHLAGVRCSGSGHGGCQASCLLHWKEAWLERVEPEISGRKAHAESSPGFIAPSATVATLESLARSIEKDGASKYFCQATEMANASEAMSNLNVAQYLRDLRSRNATFREVVSTLVEGFGNRYQRWSRKFLPNWMLIHEGRTRYDIGGALTKTPRGQLNLQPGEHVRVKNRAEIAATLDRKQRNRGLSFFEDMVKDCDSEAVVRGRISRFIDERTGKMKELANDCVTLEGKVCRRRLCPRGSYKLWREVWLTRVNDVSGQSE